MSQLIEEMSETRSIFEDALRAEFDAWPWPKTLRSACEHVLFGGGKRIRAVLSLMTSRALGAQYSDVMPWAIAVEMVHTYSLVHDDLPCMDDDDVRRGRPTCHIVYGEANAVLAGDALLTRAFGVLASAQWPAERTLRLIQTLDRAAGGSGMVGGQVHDIGGQLNDLEAVEEMQRLKTGALIRAAAEGSAIAVGASDTDISAIARYGAALGLLFQITDDILDRDEDAASGGNNLLHHMSTAAVLEYRDATAQQAEEAVTHLGQDASLLIDLVTQIRNRTV